MRADMKLVALQPQTATSNSTVTFTFDAVGFSRAVIDMFTSAPAETTAPAVLKLSEGDTTASYTDITALVAGGTGGFTAAALTTATSTTNAYRMDVDMRGRKRYLKLTVTPATDQGTNVLTIDATARLLEPNVGISGSASAQGCNQVLAV